MGCNQFKTHISLTIQGGHADVLHIWVFIVQRTTNMHSSAARSRRKVNDLRKLLFRWEVPVSGISYAILELDSH